MVIVAAITTMSVQMYVSLKNKVEIIINSSFYSKYYSIDVTTVAVQPATTEEVVIQ